MNTMIEFPTYDELEHLFKSAQIVLFPAEVHGLVCGFICAGTRLNGKLCLDMLMLDDHMADESVVKAMRDAVLNLYAASYQQIIADEFDLELLLPQDEADLSMRAKAIGEWCQGFLTGLGMAGVMLNDGESDQTRETLEQLAEISNIEYDSMQFEASDEMSLFQVTEFVRMAVYMIFTEIGLRISEASQSASSSIH